VIIGSRCKVQNGVSIYHGVTLADDVFVGPHAAFTNDKVPRAFNSDWKVAQTLVMRGASIGANSTIVCGVTVGEYAMVGAGSVVTRDVPPFVLVVGNPARPVAKIGTDGAVLARFSDV
jgi:acetyltransferase-like isoleucine patch superfamily enzyme